MTPEPCDPCGCAPPAPLAGDDAPPTGDHAADCMVCGAPLRYPAAPVPARCHYCAEAHQAEALCERDHFVCDRCHGAGALAVIEHLCATSRETDLVALFHAVRAHPSFHVHGPEHHALVPAVMVACYRNLGGEVADDALRKAIDRGAQVPGGFCGMAGTCGAPTGVSIGFSVLLGATPLTPARRQAVLRAHAAATEAVAEFEAARCCQRDGVVALRAAAELSRSLLAIPLRAEAEPTCAQVASNRECIADDCPLYP